MRVIDISQFQSLLPPGLGAPAEGKTRGLTQPMCWIAVYESTDRKKDDGLPDFISDSIEVLNAAAKRAIKENRTIQAYLMTQLEVDKQNIWKMDLIVSAFKTPKSEFRQEASIYHLDGYGCFIQGDVALEDLSQKRLMYASTALTF